MRRGINSNSYNSSQTLNPSKPRHTLDHLSLAFTAQNENKFNEAKRHLHISNAIPPLQ